MHELPSGILGGIFEVAEIGNGSRGGNGRLEGGRRAPTVKNGIRCFGTHFPGVVRVREQIQQRHGGVGDVDFREGSVRVFLVRHHISVGRRCAHRMPRQHGGGVLWRGDQIHRGDAVDARYLDVVDSRAHIGGCAGIKQEIEPLQSSVGPVNDVITRLPVVRARDVRAAQSYGSGRLAIPRGRCRRSEIYI